MQSEIDNKSWSKVQIKQCEIESMSGITLVPSTQWLGFYLAGTRYMYIFQDEEGPRHSFKTAVEGYTIPLLATTGDILMHMHSEFFCEISDFFSKKVLNWDLNLDFNCR